MNSIPSSMIIAAVLLLPTILRADPDQTTHAVFTNLMNATLSDNYDGFVADCDARMKAAVTKPMLDGVSEQIKPHAASGYEAEYMGELKQKGYEVYIWKLKFKDGSDDVLATMSLKGGKVGGFYLH